MKKIFYWSPFLSNVATIGNVLNSAYSLSKYGNNSFNTYILDVLGEWSDKKNELLKSDINDLVESPNIFESSAKLAEFAIESV